MCSQDSSYINNSNIKQVFNIQLNNICTKCKEFWHLFYNTHGATSISYTLVDPLDCEECYGEDSIYDSWDITL